MTADQKRHAAGRDARIFSAVHRWAGENRADQRAREKEERKQAVFDSLPLEEKIRKSLGSKPTHLGHQTTSAQRKKNNRNRGRRD